MEIGLIGVGSLGTFLLEQINHYETLPGYRITALYDARKKPNLQRDALAEKYNLVIYHDLATFLESSIDLVVECANIAVLENDAAEIVRQKDLMIISVGALVDPDFRVTIERIAKQHGHKVYVPAGAIGGLDVLQAAQETNGLTSVQLVTRKPLAAFSLPKLTAEQVMFDGSAEEAIVKYPKNTNIAITVSLAGLGVKATRVTVIADPLVSKNVHHLKASGTFGKLDLVLENNVSVDNPKTSYLTGLSILARLRSLTQTIMI